MNSSSGFQNSSLLGSSTGFKKRNLLRPPSGTLNKKQELLKSVDISQSQPVIATFLRGEIAAMEQEINLLDKDRKLRQDESGLQKGYVTTLRKWLRENQSMGEKEDDDVKILKQMGVDSYESGFRKLWKIAGHLDLAVTKITELQIIHFLLYDEMFDSIGTDTHRTSTLLNQIAKNPYSSGSFQITQIILERFKDVYAASHRGSSQGKSRESMKDDRKEREETQELIKQLKQENIRLNGMLEQLTIQREKEKKEVLRTASEKVIEKASSPNSFKDLEEKYEQQMKYLNSQKTNVEFQASELKAKISSLETQVKVLSQQSTPDSHLPPAKSGSYEEALMEQMEKMKKGFEKKIAKLTQEFTSREKEIRKKEIEYKSENQKIKWQKSLLLKKFQMIAK